MPELRERLSQAGHSDAATYLQSGNVVLSSELSERELAGEFERLLREWFGFDVPVVARRGEDLADVVAANPLGDVAENAKRYQVTFLSEPPPPELDERLQRLAADSERVVVRGREVYAWHPDGAARSKLWNGLAGTGLGVTGTSRNWTTVLNLADMAAQ
jgi:uncharacterized protein (DUF1697 family)